MIEPIDVVIALVLACVPTSFLIFSALMSA